MKKIDQVQPSLLRLTWQLQRYVGLMFLRPLPLYVAAGRAVQMEKVSIKLAAGLRSVARNNKATRLLTRPG